MFKKDCFRFLDKFIFVTVQTIKERRMINKKNNTIAIVVLIVLTIIGIVGFLSEKKAENPNGMVFFTSGGAVVFNHKIHSSEDEAALECLQCHHNIEEGEKSEMSCRKCHYYNEEYEGICEDAPVHKRCVGKQCVGCHEDESCSYCHKN